MGHITAPWPQLAGMIYGLLLAQAIGTEVAIGLTLVGIPVLIVRELTGRAS